MRKISFLFTLLLIITACNPPISNQSTFNQKVATGVSLAKTATAIISYFQTATISSQGTSTSMQSTLTPTPLAEDPKRDLGVPTWKDTLDSGKNWNLKSTTTTSNDTLIKVDNGSLIMTSTIAAGGKNWWLSYLLLKDFYLEAKFITQNCSGTDQYGLVFKAPNYNDGFGYYFTVTCDGRFTLMKWDIDGAAILFNLEKSDFIKAGSDQVNNLGVWIKGEVIRLYANDKLLKEVINSALGNAGYFGLFIDARQTPGFTIKMDEIAYWDIH